MIRWYSSFVRFLARKELAALQEEVDWMQEALVEAQECGIEEGIIEAGDCGGGYPWQDTEKFRARYNLDEHDLPIKKLEPIPPYAYHQAIGDFRKGCISGFYSDEDGHGEYATLTEMSGIIFSPLQLANELPDSKWTHVAWFNK